MTVFCLDIVIPLIMQLLILHYALTLHYDAYFIATRYQVCCWPLTNNGVVAEDLNKIHLIAPKTRRAAHMFISNSCNL